MSAERGNSEANIASEGVVIAQFQCAKPETMAPEVSLDTLHQRVALLPRKKARHELHHASIRVHPGKRLLVAFAPMP
jgi:hypothetical protein